MHRYRDSDVSSGELDAILIEIAINPSLSLSMICHDYFTCQASSKSFETGISVP
jgi:hypothetical protein